SRLPAACAECASSFPVAAFESEFGAAVLREGVGHHVAAAASRRSAQRGRLVAAYLGHGAVFAAPERERDGRCYAVLAWPGRCRPAPLPPVGGRYFGRNSNHRLLTAA